ncbi:hypothetical protein FSARC_10194 [Fusarium sarcochroum]|uniref:NACHT domain-containing protein n=1 Tax=Fusarium sarcochroum TaxID=1208366 RepID=A0A8H4TNS6_9HYPO|nr:hypothetical protein FSARC_10194 [Fusarium sarcochroum]
MPRSSQKSIKKDQPAPKLSRPAWYYRLVALTIKKDRDVEPEDFDEDISDLDETAEDSTSEEGGCVCDSDSENECECFDEPIDDNQSQRSYTDSDADFYYELKSEREERKRELRDIKEHERKQKAERRVLELEKEKEVKEAYKHLQEAVQRGDSLPKLDPFLGSFKLFSVDHFDYRYDPDYYPTKYVSFYTLDGSTASGGMASPVKDKTAELQGNIYLDVNCGCDFAPFTPPREAGVEKHVLGDYRGNIIVEAQIDEPTNFDFEELRSTCGQTQHSASEPDEKTPHLNLSSRITPQVMSGLEGLGIVANVIAVVDLSLQVISWCSKYAQDVKNAKSSRVQLLLATHRLHFQSEKLRGLLDDERKRAKLQASYKLAHAMGDGQFKLKELETLLSSRSRGSGLKWPLRKHEVESAIQYIEHSTEVIVQVLQVDMAGILVDLDDRAEAEQQRNILDKLPYVSDAAFDSHAEEHNPTCLPETRVDLLKEVNDWINDPHAKTVFWLNGMAGTGKSTISRTLAQSLSRTQQTENRLGASFFFKRGETDRGSMFKLIPTIARQLAASYPALAKHIQKAIQHDPTIPSKALRIQFEKLITKPLSRSSRDFPNEATIVVIVDALDECESDDDIKLIINLFSQSQVIQHPRPRIFLTSRPDLPLRLGFKAVEGTYENLILHEVATPIIEHDISLFLRHELTQIRDNWNSTVSKNRNLPANWPGDDPIRQLTKKAIPLFIFAATVCRFIADYRGRNPARQLHTVLEFQVGGASSQMDITYRPVLSQLLPEVYSPSEIEIVKNDFRRIIGPIVLLASPLSSSTLSRLLNVPQDMIDDMLGNLHSVLNVPVCPEAPIRMLHLSFRDYLVNPEYSRTNPMWVDEKQTALALVRDCFRVMDGLKSDICHLRHPAKPRSTLTPEFIDACLPPEVQYACPYWVYHQESAGIGKGDKTSEAVELTEFLGDAIMILHRHASDINATPLQLYSSVLVFAPSNSIIGKIFAAQTPTWVTILSGRTLDWDSRLQLFDAGRSGMPMATAFSLDSKLLSSISRRGHVKVWSTDTGECVEQDFDNPPYLEAAAISPDGKAIAVQPRDWWSYVEFSPLSTAILLVGYPKKIHLWCLRREKEIFSTEASYDDHEEKAKREFFAFSRDDKLLAVISGKHEVNIWSLQEAECIRNFREDKCVVKGLLFSFDSRRIATVSDDRSLRVWDISTGECLSTLLDWGESIGIAQFSPQADYIVSTSNPWEGYANTEYNIRVWDLKTGGDVAIWQLSERTVKSFLFSPDGAAFATVQHNGLIQLWDWSRLLEESVKDNDRLALRVIGNPPRVARISLNGHVKTLGVDTGATMQEFYLPTPSPTRSVDLHFSPDSTLVATRPTKECLTIWSVVDGCPVFQLEGTDIRLVFSRNSHSVATATEDQCEVCVWDRNGKEFNLKCVVSGCEGRLWPRAVSPDSQWLAAEDDSRKIWIWNLDTRKCVQTMSLTRDNDVRLEQVVFSPDSALVATRFDNDTIMVWKLATGERIGLSNSRHCISPPALSPIGTFMACSGIEEIRIWNWETGDSVRYPTLITYLLLTTAMFECVLIPILPRKTLKPVINKQKPSEKKNNRIVATQPIIWRAVAAWQCLSVASTLASASSNTNGLASNARLQSIGVKEFFGCHFVCSFQLTRFSNLLAARFLLSTTFMARRVLNILEALRKHAPDPSPSFSLADPISLTLASRRSLYSLLPPLSFTDLRFSSTHFAAMSSLIQNYDIPPELLGIAHYYWNEVCSLARRVPCAKPTDDPTDEPLLAARQIWRVCRCLKAYGVLREPNTIAMRELQELASTPENLTLFMLQRSGAACRPDGMRHPIDAVLPPHLRDPTLVQDLLETLQVALEYLEWTEKPGLARHQGMTEKNLPYGFPNALSEIIYRNSQKPAPHCVAIGDD